MRETGQPPLVVFVGDASSAEFRPAHAWLVHRSRLTTYPSIQALVTGQEEMPELVVLAESLPHQFPGVSRQVLRRHLPLTPIVGLLGSWCRGSYRLHYPAAWGIGMGWTSFVPRIARDWHRLGTGRRPWWTLAPCATDDDLLLDRYARPRPTCCGTIAVVMANQSMAEPIHRACRQAGFETVSGLPAAMSSSPAGIIWDGAWDGRYAPPALRRLRLAQPDVPLIALLGFPTHHDLKRLQAQGVDVLLPKPFETLDLLWYVETLQGPKRAVDWGSR
jgi:CheY-like chemotaxis protein